jgi:antitoxin component YwqK of YwqJK toxin-antitoxin module
VLVAACLAVALLVPGIAHALQDCDIDGQPVNTSNGATTAGKSGLLRCVDRDSGKLVREERYVDGRPLGYRKSVGFDGQVSVGNYNERGNADGELRTYYPDGTLRSIESYRDGSHAGLSRYLHRNGAVSRLSWSEPGRGTLAEIGYTERGQLAALRCGPRSLFDEDRKPCGFEGAVESDLHDARGEVVAQVRHDQGVRVAFRTYAAPGVLAGSEDVEGSRTVRRQYHPGGALRLETVLVERRRQSEREFARTGQRIRETEWDDAGRAVESTWYLNGAMKRRDSRTVYEGTPATAVEEWWDNGQLRLRGTYGERGRPLGVVQTFHESGPPESELYYERGNVARRRAFDTSGRLVLDEEYFEDGSRKSTMRR